MTVPTRVAWLGSAVELETVAALVRVVPVMEAANAGLPPPRDRNLAVDKCETPEVVLAAGYSPMVRRARDEWADGVYRRRSSRFGGRGNPMVDYVRSRAPTSRASVVTVSWKVERRSSCFHGLAWLALPWPSR